MRSTTPPLVSLLLALTAASLLGCADASAPLDPSSTEAAAGTLDQEVPPPGAPAHTWANATSAVYPAPHPGMPRIPMNGGVVLHDPTIVTVTFPGDPLRDKLQALGEQIGDFEWWSTVHAGYGVGPARSGGSVALTEAPATALNDDDVERWLAARIGSGVLPAPTDQTIYMLYYPSSTTVTLRGPDGGAASCRVFLGYHSSITVNRGGQSIPVAYAVVNRCSPDLDSVTATASHELTEAATDPHPIDGNTCGFVTLEDNAWTGLGGENADMCAAVSGVTEGGFHLTRVWNNLTAAAGDQPCLPAPESSPYYNAAIVRETVALSPGSTTQTEIDCYSFGPLAGPMTLDVRVAAQSPLKFSFDRKTCTNGDKVTLTIGLTAGAARGTNHHYTLLSSIGPESAHLWRGMVHVQ